MDFTIENHLKIVETDRLIGCLSLLPNLYKDKNVNIVIHSQDTACNSGKGHFYSAHSGNFGFYSISNKDIQIFSCNFMDSVFNQLDVINIITLYGIIHELRHSVQHKLMPKTFDNILSGKTNYFRYGSKYKEQFIEKDARRFTERFFNKFKHSIDEYLGIKAEWSYKNNVIMINGFELSV